MQLAAAISEEDGDENKDEEEEGDESEEDDISRYGFFIRMQYRVKFAVHAFVAMFTWKFIKKMSRLIRNITFKEIILFTIITSYKLAKVGFQFFNTCATIQARQFGEILSPTSPNRHQHHIVIELKSKLKTFKRVRSK